MPHPTFTTLQDQCSVIELLQEEVRREKDKQVATLDENAALKDEVDRLRDIIRELRQLP
jgi:hypothetical protein